MKNCSCATTRGPSLTTRAVSAQAARNVMRLIAMFSSGAQRRAPKAPRAIAPKRGVLSNRRNSTLGALLLRGRSPAHRRSWGCGLVGQVLGLVERLAFLEGSQMMEVETVELLAD